MSARVSDFAGPVDRAGFGRLRQRQGAGLGRLDEPARKPVERLAQGVHVNLAALPRDADQLRTAGEEFRRAAFVVMNVRFLVAEHGLERLSQRRQGKRIGGGSGRDEKGFGPRLEDLAEHCSARAV